MSAAPTTVGAPADRHFPVFAAFAAAGAAASLALLAARTMSAISFSEPLQLHTSGDEFASHFAVWRHLHALPVFTDRFSPPFSYAVYNWLFYEAYGTVTGWVLGLLDLGEAWIPTVTRLISLAAMVVGLGGAYVVFYRASEGRDRTTKAVCLAFAVFVMAGPLVGFWNITARPDLWARTLEVLAVAVFLAHYPGRRWAAVAWFIALAYLAWAFKQGSVFAAGGVGLFLLARRQWGPLAVLAAVLPALWGATLLVGEPQYVFNVLLREFPLIVSADRLARNVLNFAVKSGPVLLFLAGLAVAAWRARVPFTAFWRRDAFVVAFGGALCATALALPASAQSGGAENYYFTLSFFLTLMAVAALPVVREAGETVTRPVLAAGNLGWATLVAAVALVFSGVVGVIDVRPMHDQFMAAKRCLDTLPRPLFVPNGLLSLPWMTPGNYPWVIAYDYPKDRKYGRAFKGGGIGGMVASGDFEAVAVQKPWAAAAPPTEVDGGSLIRYRLMNADPAVAGACPDMFVFFRNPATTAPAPPAPRR